MTANHEYILSLDGSVVTVGNFDGVHRGHQELLRKTVAIARAAGLPAVVLTFNPHPSVALGHRKASEVVLSTPEEKIRLIKELGIDHVISMNFDHETIAMTARDFIAKVLVGRLSARHVLVGSDFRFGNGRTGDYTLLQNTGHELGFATTAMDIMGAKIQGLLQQYSSSTARRALMAGDFTLLNAILGREYTLRCAVDDVVIFHPGYALSVRHETMAPSAGLYDATLGGTVRARVRISGDGAITAYLLEAPPAALSKVVDINGFVRADDVHLAEYYSEYGLACAG